MKYNMHICVYTPAHWRTKRAAQNSIFFMKKCSMNITVTAHVMKRMNSYAPLLPCDTTSFNNCCH